ncbi:MAG: hypothetical protein RJA22_3257 [Verrucomicrobiota bacterium]
MPRVLLQFLACACLCLGAGAAPGPAVSSWAQRVWQADDGLPESTVLGVAQTPEGYLWVATPSGLARFDGVRFREVLLPAAANGVHQVVRVVMLGRRGDLWLALEGGTAMRLRNTQQAGFEVVGGLPPLRPVAMAEDGAGVVWIGYADGSACRIAGGQAVTLSPRELHAGAGRCWVAGDSEGRVWFAKGGRVGMVSGGTLVEHHVESFRATSLGAARHGGVWACAGGRILKCEAGGGWRVAGDLAVPGESLEPSALLEDRAGALWIGTAAHGLFRFDGTNTARVPTPHGDIRCLAEDREGNLWVGTAGGGLSRVRPAVVEWHAREAGLPFETVRSACEDGRGRIWAAGQNGDLARLAGGVWERVSTNAAWPGGPASCVEADGADGVWVGTLRAGLVHWRDGEGLRLRRRDGLAGDNVRALLRDTSGALWIGLEASNCVQQLREGRFRTLAQPPGSRPIRAMAEDAAHQVWLGTTDGLLLRAGPGAEGLVDETARTLERPRPIRCLHATPDGALWIGYAEAGLGRWKDGRFARLGREHGLPEDSVSQMAADGRGGMWLAGNRGLCLVTQRELDAVADGRAARVQAISFGRDEAVPVVQASVGHAPAAMRSRDGRVWFSTRSGLAAVNPARLLPNRLPPPVYLERVAVDGGTVDLPGRAEFWPEAGAPPARRSGVPVLEVAPGHRKAEFEFTALSFAAPENVRFRHQLEGFDEGWVESGTARSAGYPRLPAGRYRFRVMACNNAGVWNETGAALAFVVQPFVWQTWWFRALAMAAFTLAVVALVRRASFRRLRARLAVLQEQSALHQERTRIAKDIHDDLGASLTQISLLGELAQHDAREPEKVGEHAGKIAATARQVSRSLDEIVWAVNPRNDTLPHLLDYVGQYAVDFLRAAGVRCRVDFPGQPPARAVPADVRHNLFLIVKEALNNVAKHAGAREVRLRAAITAGGLQLVVEDDGCGLAGRPAADGADGLANMRQRAAEIGGHCQVAGAAGQGTRVTVEVPWRD